MPANAGMTVGHNYNKKRRLKTMKTTEINTKNWNEFDEINGEISVSLKDCDGAVISIAAIAIGTDDIEKFGSEQEVATIRSEDGEYYSTISRTAIRTLKKMISIVDSSGTINAKVSLRKTKDNSDFIALTALVK